MANQLVTVFGASGFIGRHLIQRLAARGYRVRAVTRDPNAALYLKPLGSVGQIQLFQANIRDEKSTARAIGGADMVVNLVGILAESGRQRFAAVHAAGAERVARLSAAAGVRRLVQISAIGADAQSDSHYAATKARGEEAVRHHFPAATILRPSIVFGPDDRFFNRFAEMARISPVLPLIGGGKTRFQPVYVGDVADAIIRSLEAADGVEGKVFELGGPDIYTFREIMELILRETGRTRLLLSIPFGLARFIAMMPCAPVTADQLRQLHHDNVVAAGAAGFKALGLTPDSVEANVPAYLWRFRKEGEFTTAPAPQSPGD